MINNINNNPNKTHIPLIKPQIQISNLTPTKPLTNNSSNKKPLNPNPSISPKPTKSH